MAGTGFRTMLNSTVRVAASALGLTVFLAACSSYGGLNRESFAACINEAGITGPYSASSLLRNGRTTFVVRTGPNVTEAQAAIADACIARTIDSPLPTQNSVGGGLEQRTAVRTDGNLTTETYTYGTPPAAVRSATPRPTSAGCVAGGGPMQGGTGYCTRN
jgi:hypothetical protein